MEVDRDVKVWNISFLSALLSYIFASLGFNGFLNIMALGGFMIVFGTLMITTTLLEERFLED